MFLWRTLKPSLLLAALAPAGPHQPSRPSGAAAAPTPDPRPTAWEPPSDGDGDGDGDGGRSAPSGDGIAR